MLEAVGMNFTVRVSSVEENFPDTLLAEEVPAYLARKKAEAVKGISSPHDLIVAADTIVLLDNQVIGKPEGQRQAKATLRLLSGRKHQVISGVCLMWGDQVSTFSETTDVFFRKLSEAQIDFYVHHYRPFDKAGAYAIQEWIGLVGVERIEGDYFNVVGLPVGRLVEEIKAISTEGKLPGER